MWIEKVQKAGLCYWLCPWATWLWGSMEKPETFYTADWQPETHTVTQFQFRLSKLLQQRETEGWKKKNQIEDLLPHLAPRPSYSSHHCPLCSDTSLLSPRLGKTEGKHRYDPVYSACTCVCVRVRVGGCLQAFADVRVGGDCLPLHPEHWMKKLMRSRREESLSVTYASIQSSITACSHMSLC